MVGIVLMILLKPKTDADEPERQANRTSVTSNMVEVGDVVSNPLPDGV